MSDAAYFPPAATARPSDEPAPRTARERPRRYRGPVLMGDLLTSIGGRPLLLMHWDDPER